MSEKIIEREYEAAFANVASTSPVFPYRAKLEMLELVEEKIRSNSNVSIFSQWDNDPAQLGGFIAEEWHSTTYNMDAIVKGKTARAQTGLDNGVIGNNDKVSDLAIVDHGKVVKKVQSKYYRDAQTTANKHATVRKDGSGPKFEDANVALSPADQVPAIRQKSLEGYHRKMTQAERLRQQDGSPDLVRAHEAKAEAYKQTAQKAAATIEHDGASSAPLTKSEANAFGAGDIGKLETTQSQYETRSTVQNMRKAASGAAAMSAVVAGTVNIVNYVGLVRAGKIDASEAAVKIAAETAASAADSAMKAAATTGLQSMIVRLGSREAAQSMASQSVSALLRSNAISVGVVCAIDAIKDLVLFGAGKLTLAELEERSGKNLFSTAAGTVGGSIGASICGGLVMGGALAPAALPVLGGLAGGLIASMAMAFAIENGIEAPYRELVTNTQTLRESAIILQDVSNRFLEGQVYFEQFMAADAALDQSFNEQAAIIKRSGEDMRQAIDRI
ncbi:MAG: hypothetical protein B7Z80_25125 [Rhodospirillales bacterium 20-64-7]|nr:MAG: hypothetical protein B7Z80_25125 [Rhodospirillales bacterium 20-64-7]